MRMTRQVGAQVAGRIRYDNAVTRVQMEVRAVVEREVPVADDIRQVWGNLNRQK